MEPYLPVLLIITPLIAAPLCVLVRHRVAAFGLALAVCWATFAMAIMLLERVLDEPTHTISYHLGGWQEPWGIEYRVDTLSAFVLLFVSGIGAIVLSFAPQSIACEIPKDQHYLFSPNTFCV